MAGLDRAVYSDGREVEQEATEAGTRVRGLMPPAAAARAPPALLNGAAA